MRRYKVELNLFVFILELFKSINRDIFLRTYLFTIPVFLIIINRYELTHLLRVNVWYQKTIGMTILYCIPTASFFVLLAILCLLFIYFPLYFTCYSLPKDTRLFNIERLKSISEIVRWLALSSSSLIVPL